MFPICSATWKQQNHTDHWHKRKKSSQPIYVQYTSDSPTLWKIRTLRDTHSKINYGPQVLWEATAWRAVAARDPMKRKHGPIISINMSPRKSKTPLKFNVLICIQSIYNIWPLAKKGGWELYIYILFLLWVITRCHFRKAPLPWCQSRVNDLKPIPRTSNRESISES